MGFRLSRLIVFISICVVLITNGCHSPDSPAQVPITSNNQEAVLANLKFRNQRHFDPWILKSTDSQLQVLPYLSNGLFGWRYRAGGDLDKQFYAGVYRDGGIKTYKNIKPPISIDLNQPYLATLNFSLGTLSIQANGRSQTWSSGKDWQSIWKSANVKIEGDPESAQTAHASLFYLLASTRLNSTCSIPPMGLSSNSYQGHIFWDADVWMLPALMVQHPDYARSIVDYRYKLLGQARINAKNHGYRGCEYPWESTDTGSEVAPAEFAKERHVTADAAYAAWQYYLWTGDRDYLRKEGWPILKSTAEYWVSRVQRDRLGTYHIYNVLSPDETAGLVDDDAYTNAVVVYNLFAAITAANKLALRFDPRWKSVALKLCHPFDHLRKIPAENNTPLNDQFRAKQADVLLLLNPLGQSINKPMIGRMLDFYTGHTIETGPAMTKSVESIAASRCDRVSEAYELFLESYQPYMRGPWDAFSEKKTTNNVYFLTGMSGCLQSIFYGFAGLQAVSQWQEPTGGIRLISTDAGALWCDPHLPPQWKSLEIDGISFGSHKLNITISHDNSVKIVRVN